MSDAASIAAAASSSAATSNHSAGQTASHPPLLVHNQTDATSINNTTTSSHGKFSQNVHILRLFFEKKTVSSRAHTIISVVLSIKHFIHSVIC